MRHELDSLCIDLEFIVEELEFMDNNSTIYGTGYGNKWKKQTLENHQLSTEKCMHAFKDFAVRMEMNAIAIVKILNNL